jgi:hypothetical protein
MGFGFRIHFKLLRGSSSLLVDMGLKASQQYCQALQISKALLKVTKSHISSIFTRFKEE